MYLQKKFDRVLKAAKDRAIKKQAPNFETISAFLDAVVVPMPPGGTRGGCGKCVWSREGCVFDGVTISPKEFNMNHTNYGACDDYAHCTSIQHLYARVKVEFPSGDPKGLKMSIRAYMESIGAFMLGMSEEEKANEEGRTPNEGKRKSENSVALHRYVPGSGQPVRGEFVDVDGNVCGRDNRHHRVYMGYLPI
jgi:hypothetical protein